MHEDSSADTILLMTRYRDLRDLTEYRGIALEVDWACRARNLDDLA
jgi:hypothetical protein